MKHTVSKEQTLLEAAGEMAPESSKTSLRQWIKIGRIRVDGQVKKRPDHPVLPGQTIDLGDKKPKVRPPVQILYQDAHLIAVNKPKGMLSVAAAFEKEKTVFRLLKEMVKPQSVFVVHRLDQDTSGVMLFAKTQQAQYALKDIFADHTIQRQYVAIVEGEVEQDEGTWDTYLIEDANYKVHVTSNKQKGERAITHYQVENRRQGYTRLRLELETGKKNQIRVHAADAGYPVTGDQKYGAAANPLSRLALHAHILQLIHPVTGKPLEFESPIPVSFNQFLGPR